MPTENRKVKRGVGGATACRRRHHKPGQLTLDIGTGYQKSKATSLRVIKDNIDNLCAVMVVGTARVEPSDN
jgi:predicted NAD/FAD-dependent oxidoreductase